MTNATDIITYIGVPLAVLGVLPILYTLLRAVLTARSIRKTLLRHGHLPATTTRPDGFTIRSSPMTSLIEVDLPRYTIAALERANHSYWNLDDSVLKDDHHALLRAESTLSMVEEGRVQGFLRGGSWRTFHWKKLVVGRKLYRIQWEDELREPPAEIDFADLVNFLMDWGAVPHSQGWEQLKLGGLWTPGGTVILQRASDESEKAGTDWVLRTSVPDESDGVLSLSVRWSVLNGTRGSDRGTASLGPGWARLKQPGKGPISKQVGDKGLEARVEQARLALKPKIDSESVRFCMDGTKVSIISWEHEGVPNGEQQNLWSEDAKSGFSLWFACAASALSRQYQVGVGLWSFDTPLHILNLVSKDSIPCGVMVHLSLLAHTDVPAWAPSVDRSQPINPAMQPHRRQMEQQRRMREESVMAPEQAKVARMNREAEERQASLDELMSFSIQSDQRREVRLAEVIASPKLKNKAVAEACMVWLTGQKQIERGHSLQTLAEAILYLLIVDQRPYEEAVKVVEVLDEWQIWSQHGGMSRSHLDFLKERKVEFCFAAVIIHIIEDAAHTSSRSGEVMKECLRLWRKVRLG